MPCILALSDAVVISDTSRSTSLIFLLAIVKLTDNPKLSPTFIVLELCLHVIQFNIFTPRLYITLFIFNSFRIMFTSYSIFTVCLIQHIYTRIVYYIAYLLYF